MDLKLERGKDRDRDGISSGQRLHNVAKKKSAGGQWVAADAIFNQARRSKPPRSWNCCCAQQAHCKAIGDTFENRQERE